MRWLVRTKCHVCNVLVQLPHLLFYGPPGTGKTSTILALARDLFGPELYRQRILELNASDERGISVIREKVKQFAKVTARETVPGYPCPPFKLIVLDEADSLTNDAQTALRRVIEVSSKTTRFCLICNYVSRIIDPLTSRCAKFRFRPVEPADGLQKLRQIAAAEAVNVSETALRRILEVTGGDLRRTIGLLQSAFRLQGAHPIEDALIDELAGVIPESLIQDASTILLQTSPNPSTILSFVQDQVVTQGFPAAQFIQQLAKRLLNDPGIAEMAKALLAIKLAEIDFALTEGADEHLQLLSLFFACHSLFTSKSSVLI